MSKPLSSLLYDMTPSKDDLNKRKIVFDLFFIFLLGLMPLLWFKGFSLIAGGEFDLILNPLDGFFRHLYVWDSRRFAGYNNTQWIAYLFPYSAFFAFLEYLRLSLPLINRLWFIFIFTLPGLSMYYFTITILRGQRRRIASLISATFLMFNMSNIDKWSGGGHIVLLAHAILPIMLALFIIGLAEKRSWFRHSVLIGITSLLFASSGSNPSTYGVIFIVFSLYLLFYIAVSRKRAWKFTFKFCAVTIFIAFVVNLWWIIPTMNFVQANIGSASTPNLAWLHSQSQGSSFLNNFRLLGEWFFFGNYYGEPYVSFAHYFRDNLPQIITSFLLPILAFSAIILKPRDKYVIFFSLLAVIAIFLGKGTHQPLGNLYEWLYREAPGFFLFRSPYQKFSQIIAFSYAFLIGITGSELYYNIERRILDLGENFTRDWHLEKITKSFPKLVSLILILVVIFSNSWPLFSGGVFRPEGKILGDPRINIPTYYKKAEAWLKGEKGFFRLFLFPGGYLATYRWGYSGNDIMHQLLVKPQVSSNPFVRDRMGLTDLLYKSLKGDTSLRRINQILGLLSVKYILFQNDRHLNWEHDADRTGDTVMEFVESRLFARENIRPEKTFGKLDFYKIDDKYFLPHIYIASKVIPMKGGMNRMGKLITLDSFKFTKPALFLSKQLTFSKWQFIEEKKKELSSDQPKINFKKINPTRYKVKVKAKGPYFLVFLESFHTGWKAYIKRTTNGERRTTSKVWETWFKKPLPESKHFLINGYANSWYIDKPGNYEVILEFWPQRLFYLGLGISLITLMGCIIYLMIPLITRIVRGTKH